MTAASRGDPKKSDDLTVIKGISKTREKVLRESLDIHTFKDLASASADEIKSQMKNVSKNSVEQWIAEARELPAAKVAKPNNSPAPGSEWKLKATFVVEFQEREDGEERRTRVHRLDYSMIAEEEVDKEWPEIESVQLSRWMMEQLGEPAPEMPEQVRAEAREELEQELEEMRTEARQELQDEMKAERASLQQEIERELEERRTEAQQTLDQELRRASDTARKKLQKELKAERARRQKEIEEELDEQKAEAHDELQQELQEARTKAQLELDQELEAERTRLKEEIEQELEERRAETREELEQELEEVRAEAREALVPEPGEPAKEEAAPIPEPVAPAEEKAPPELVAIEEPPQLVIEGSHVYQPPQVETPRILGITPSSPDALRRDIPFSLVTSFSVDEAEANELAGKGVTYTAQFQAHEISTGKVIQLGTTLPEKFVTGKSTYEARLSDDVTLPAGFYQLTVFLSVGTTPPGGIYRQVSVLLMA